MPSPFTRQECETQISDRLIELAGKLRSRTRLSLNDASHGLEPVMGRFLNALFGWDLHDLNLGQTNHPAADLGDATRRIAVQLWQSGPKALECVQPAAAFYSHPAGRGWWPVVAPAY